MASTADSQEDASSVTKLGRLLRSGALAWRRSLRLRVMATTVIVGILAVAVLGAFLSSQIRDGIFEERREQILQDAASRTDRAQAHFNSANAATHQDVQQLSNDIVQSLNEGTAGIAGVMLMRPPGTVGFSDVLLPSTDRRLADLITPELRAQVQSESFQQWQSVTVPPSTPGGNASPGIAVGSVVTLPIIGEHHIFFIYTLSTEAQTLVMLQQVLIVGAAVLIGLLVVMGWYLARQVLDPVGVAADTARKLSQGKLTVRMPVRGRDELAVLGRTFNDMAQNLQDQIEQLAELSRMQQQFVSDVSHELRTPLTTIRMAAELLHAERESFTPAQARSAELLATQVDRFEAMLAELLEISRFDAGSAVLEVEETDVRTIVDRLVHDTAPLAHDRGAVLNVNATQENCTADVDPRRVERVLRNLVVNAIEHGESEPIDINVASNATAVSVSVRDHGIGMTAPEAERVFDRFWRADPSRTRTLGGTGLGLAISLEDAHLHGGTLEAWGSPGEGAAFRLTVPRRAGLPIEHALELAPLRTLAEPAPRHEPHDPTGPATLPDLTESEVRQ